MILSNVQNVKFYTSYHYFLFHFMNNMAVKGQLHVFTHTQKTNNIIPLNPQKSVVIL